MSDKKRQCMNYRKGDDLIHGPLEQSEKVAAAPKLIIRPKDWVRTTPKYDKQLMEPKVVFRPLKKVALLKGAAAEEPTPEDHAEHAAEIAEANERRQKFIEYHNLGRELRYGRCNVHVLSASQLTLDQCRLLDLEHVSWQKLQHVEQIEADIDYPLKHKVTVKFGPYLINGRPRMTTSYILWQLARAYRQIYEEEAEDGRHGVWGHCLNDLYFERVRPHASGYCELQIGS